MIEQLIYSLLLALHNLALVGCAAAPFYNRSLVVNRGKFGQKLILPLDNLVENTLQGNAGNCLVFITTLFITGVGMPLNYYAFNGAFKDLHFIAYTALVLKVICVVAMGVIMFKIFSHYNPKIKILLEGFNSAQEISPEKEKEFFQLRKRRRKLCEICLGLAIAVLIFSAFLGLT